MKEIKLSQSIKRKNHILNLVAFVDDNDYDYLNQWAWCADKSKNTYYAHRCITVGGKRFKIKMHRLIIGVYSPEVLIDHRDGDGLNNCKNNLRVCTPAQNSMNRLPLKIGKSSKYKGVHLDKGGRWIASIGGKKKSDRYLGTFGSEVDAAKAYNEAAKKHFGEFAKLNDL